MDITTQVELLAASAILCVRHALVQQLLFVPVVFKDIIIMILLYVVNAMWPVLLAMELPIQIVSPAISVMLNMIKQLVYHVIYPVFLVLVLLIHNVKLVP